MEKEVKPDISETSLVPLDAPNPWSSAPSYDDDSGAAPDMSPLPSYVPPDEYNDSNVQVDSKTTESASESLEPSVLKEFDPLVTYPSLNEDQKAWATTEGKQSPQVHLSPSENNPRQETSEFTSPSNPVKLSRASLTPVQTAPAFITAIPSSIATFAKNLSLSPKRSVTPPLPPPPRTSSLRHSHHSSLPVNALPSSSNTEINQLNTAREADHSVTSSSSKSDTTFDFQKFLDQMKSRGADPIAKYLRSFLSNFAKKTYTVKEQIKVINDFLNFIADKMRNLDGSPWQHATQQEFEHALDAMEKLVMNRLYEFTFQPLLPPALRTTDDIERDHVLRQRIMLFGWLLPEHLDIPFKDPHHQSEEIKGFLEFAQQELLKVNHYKAPRDKLICVLNCCKVIFGLIRHLKLSEGADSFLPILIYVVLKANPDHLLSNVEFINRFRRQDKLQSEAGYYLSSLMGAVSFIETMDHTALSNITQEEFEEKVETAIESLSIDRIPTPPSAAHPTPQTKLPLDTHIKITPSLVGEEPAKPLSLPMPDHPSDATEPSQLSLAQDTRKFFQKTSDTISKPLATIGRIFGDILDDQRLSRNHNEVASVNVDRIPQTSSPSLPLDSSSRTASTTAANQVPYTSDSAQQAPIQPPYKPRVRPTHLNAYNRLSTASGDLSRGLVPPNQQTSRRSTPSPLPSRTSSPAPGFLYVGTPQSSRMPTPTLDLGALQDEIDRAHVAAHNAARETLKQIFPSVETEVTDMILEANNGDLGRSIEALLEISGQHNASS